MKNKLVFATALGVMAAITALKFFGNVPAAKDAGSETSNPQHHLPLPKQANTNSSQETQLANPNLPSQAASSSIGASFPEIQKLESLVREGTTVSLLEAAKILRVCASSELLKSAAPNTIVPGYCQRISPTHARMRMEWVESAVKARIPGAGSEFLANGPNGNVIDLYQRKDDLLVREWKVRALEILEGEAKRGDLEAIGTLRDALSAQGIGPADVVRSYAYQRVLWTLQDPANANVRLKQLDSISQLNPEEVQASAQLANKLLNEIREGKK